MKSQDLSQELVDTFDRSFSKVFQAETLQLLDSIYKESQLLIAQPEYSPEFGRNLRPQIRVEKFNTQWVNLSKQHGLSASRPHRLSVNNYSIALIEGKEMIMTVKLVEKPFTIPKDILYIKNFASSNPTEKQLKLFNLDSASHPSKNVQGRRRVISKSRRAAVDIY